ncbi:hypothetical protein AUP68_04766 [Ilyonectria robusta]
MPAPSGPTAEYGGTDSSANTNFTLHGKLRRGDVPAFRKPQNGIQKASSKGASITVWQPQYLLPQPGPPGMRTEQRHLAQNQSAPLSTFVL